MKKTNIGRTFELKEPALTSSEAPIIKEPSAEVKALQKEIFNIKFDYDRLLNFTKDLLTHEQHVKFAAKKKEIFG